MFIRSYYGEKDRQRKLKTLKCRHALHMMPSIRSVALRTSGSRLQGGQQQSHGHLQLVLPLPAAPLLLASTRIRWQLRLCDCKTEGGLSHSSVKESDNYTMSPYATAQCVYIIILDILTTLASLRSVPFIDRTKIDGKRRRNSNAICLFALFMSYAKMVVGCLLVIELPKRFLNNHN